MRLTLRLLTLAVLLSVASFTGLVSPASKADDGGSACTDGCFNGWNSCNSGCGPPAPPICKTNCDTALDTCMGKCRGNFE